MDADLAKKKLVKPIFITVRALTQWLIRRFALQVEICRFGCPDHCQSPAEYVAREQVEISTSLNNKRQIPQTPNVRNPFLSGNNYRQTYQQQNRRTAIPPPPPAPPRRPPPPQQTPNVIAYQPDPRNAPNALPQPLPLLAKNDIPPPPPAPSQQIAQSRVAHLPDGLLEHGQGKKSPSNGLFGDLVSGLKLPELPKLPSFPFFGGNHDAVQSKSDSTKGESIAIPLGPKPKIEVKFENHFLIRLTSTCFVSFLGWKTAVDGAN